MPASSPGEEGTPALPRVGFQGEPGAYGDEAIQAHFGPGGAIAQGYPSFAETFDAFRRREVDLALVPVENSYAGSVHEVFDLIMDTPEAVVVGEVLHPVHHCLLAPAGTGLGQVRRALSHPQALAQCAPFLKAHGILPVPAHDTAGAARQVAEERPPETAAVAGEGAARRYGLAVLARNIEAVPFNTTRFLLLGREPAPPTERSKTSVLLWTAHMPGSLASCLNAIAEQGLNLTKIESRPSREGPWQYVFYLDFEGHPESPAGKAALRELGRRAQRVRLLGAYPMAGGGTL